MRVVSFYTPGTRYETDAARLRESCERFGLAHDVREIPKSPIDGGARGHPGASSAAWVSSVARKPFFIRDMLLEHRAPICWMDADCEIVRDPVLVRASRAEFAIYNFFADPMNETGEYAPHKLWGASGVVYLAFTPRVMRLVTEWCEKMDDAPWMVDDQALSWVYNHFRGGKLRVQWLPRAYNRMSAKWPEVEPVINHAWQPGLARAR
jgi:hypothetical protein